MKQVFLALVLAVLLTGCGTSRTSSSPNLTGTWDGTVTDGYFGNGTFTANINQSGSTIDGDYTVTFNAGTYTGVISGTLSGSNLTFAINVAGCTANGTATASSTHFSGSYTYASGCAAAGYTGTFSGNKR